MKVFYVHVECGGVASSSAEIANVCHQISSAMVMLYFSFRESVVSSVN